jgi:hypothetical protein
LETAWEDFDRSLRSRGCVLLQRIHEFPDSILVSGCQRSGTTMLSRILTNSDEMVNFYFSARDELDAALILSGSVAHEPRGRYCFQTTYIDDCFNEYYERDGNFRIVWMIRNPLSVAHSMLYRWLDQALDETFRRCCVPLRSLVGGGLKRWIASVTTSRLGKACAIYNAKVEHLLELRRRLEPRRLMVVDYDALVRHSGTILAGVFQFADGIHTDSLDSWKAMSEKEIAIVRSRSHAHYQRALALVSPMADS